MKLSQYEDSTFSVVGQCLEAAFVAVNENRVTAVETDRKSK